MKLQHRIRLLNELGQYILSADPAWLSVRQRAEEENGWFIPAFVEYALQHLARAYLPAEKLEEWIAGYEIAEENAAPKTVGITMAGNIPLAGFHDLLSVFISGHRAHIRPSSKDDALLRHLVEKLEEWGAENVFAFPGMLKHCDAYIATGSNNSSRYFMHYFGKYPHIIRRNRSSAAILRGNESREQLEKLADDVCLYFGLGCRNVTSLYVPRGFDFVPLLDAFKKFGWLMENHKYRNNYDYNLAILLLNRVEYMSTGSLLLAPSPSLFSPVSQLHYAFYDDFEEARVSLLAQADLQCLVSDKDVPFGEAQQPAVSDYADGVDSLEFLQNLTKRT